MTLEEAHAALSRFVHSAFAAERRCLLIITGKGARGEGALKRKVPMWLAEAAFRATILGLATARPQHGGDGALYLLLRRRRADGGR